MEQTTSAGIVLMILLAALLYASVAIVEVPDDDAESVFIADAVDGDTVKLSDGRRVRLVGYDAYELSEQLGQQAKQALRDLCSGKAYLDVDDLEPRDRYGRILGYLWCQRTDGNVTWYVSVQKFFVVGDGRRYVKKLLHVPPDEHPYTLWMTRHVIIFNRATEIYVYNDSRAPYRIYGNAVMLTSGVYEVYYEGRLVARLRLMSHNATTINLSIVDGPAVVPPVSTATTTPATAAQTVTTATQATTRTAITAVKELYIHPIVYIVIAVAVVVLAVYLARRSRSAT